MPSVSDLFLKHTEHTRINTKRDTAMVALQLPTILVTEQKEKTEQRKVLKIFLDHF